MSDGGAPDCLIVQPIAEAGLARLRAAGLRLHIAERPDFAELGAILATIRAVITRNAGFTADAIAAAPHLLVIGSHGTGTDAIDKVAATARGITIVNTPGANARSVAELAFGLILAMARRIPAADRAVRAGNTQFRLEARGRELAGSTLGLVGFGHVARAMVPFARAFDMHVIGFSRHADAATLAEAGIEKHADLHTLLARADIVSLHSAGERGVLLGPAAFAAMKPGALLVNTARGALVDELALATALASGRLAGAALDVTAIEPLPAASPLLRAPNLVLTPHIGGSTDAALKRTAVEIADKVIATLEAAGAIGSARR